MISFWSLCTRLKWWHAFRNAPDTASGIPMVRSDVKSKEAISGHRSIWECNHQFNKVPYHHFWSENIATISRFQWEIAQVHMTHVPRLGVCKLGPRRGHSKPKSRLLPLGRCLLPSHNTPIPKKSSDVST